MDPIYYVLVFSVLGLLSISVIGAMIWSIRSGHLADLIFDDDEPVGQMTDAFPGQSPRRSDGREDKDAA